MKSRRSPEQAFNDLLEQGGEAPGPLSRMAKLAQALETQARPGPDPRFKARLRSELLARATASEEDEFAMALELEPLEAPEEIRPLVAIAAALEPARRALPDPSFRYQLRSQLVAEAQRRRPVGARLADRMVEWNARMRRSLRVVGATAVAAAMMLSGGLAFASAGSALPHEGIRYDLKLLRESAQLLVVSGEEEGDRLLAFARVRYRELLGMSEAGVDDRDPYVETLDRMDDQTVRGSTILIGVFRDTGDRGPLERARSFAEAQRNDLAALVDRLPPVARPAALDSLTITEKVVAQVTAVQQGCSPCATNPLAPPGTVGSAGTADEPDPQTSVGCACDQPAGSGTGEGSGSGGSGDPGDGDGDGNGDPGDGDGDGGPTTDDPDAPDPQVDVPDVPDTQVDEDVEESIDDLLDDLATTSPTVSPAPLPSVDLPEPTLSLP